MYPNGWATRLAGFAALSLISAAGCGQHATVHGVADGGSSWTIMTDDATPGIDAASVSVVTLKAGPPDGVPFVVWSDLPNGRSGSGGGRVGGASYEGNHRATDGRQIAFQARTNDGETGVITIAESEYHMRDGSLFLVSTQHDPPDVAQLDFDVADFPRNKEELIALAKSTDAIRTFFEQRKEPVADGP